MYLRSDGTTGSWTLCYGSPIHVKVTIIIPVKLHRINYNIGFIPFVNL